MTLNRVDRPDTIALALQIAAQLPLCHADALEVLAFGREDCLPGAHRADAAVGRPMRSASMPKPGARRHRSSFPRVISPLRGPARRRTDPAERPSTYYRLWTLKEAFLKATAQDLAAQLDSFFRPRSGRNRRGSARIRIRLAFRRVSAGACTFARLGGAVAWADLSRPRCRLGS
jgi:hypothetical protein